MKSSDFEVLVVDDDPDIVVIIVAELKRAGYPERSAQDGEMALQLIRTRVPSVVLTDIKMPKMGGLELLATIRHEWPALPVILMSGLPPITEEEGAALGAYAMLPKPFEASALLLILNRLGSHSP